ncbi:ABC transporter ATP-binding protein [Methanothermococcus okinawensis]|uniref:Phosphonate-transporting ATPase n=1 Tax=Methanothermococcus okinawensis (strain DSM 14208 / JCM 11175 / IH1) TaxID=647113 RepID=F8ALY4_METOI|nr:ABC transporter ATP-binding protein [Methanothermococcus okinawensis]AEH06659.1 Phosphonate-transporting ATPase [Methanothermococcus okinawensis IH1]
MTFIEVKNLWKIYGKGEAKTVVLKGLNLKIDKGEFVIITGPSGCGKSTFLNILGLLDVPNKGMVYINGKKTTLMSENERAIFRRKISGFVFQQFHLINTLTALENVELPMMLNEMDKSYRIKRAKKLLKSVGLEKRANHYPNQLSGGQMQRVAIARALANKPKIIFADEPTGNLDSKSGNQVMNMLRELHDNGITIIMVTHELEYTRYATKVVKMKDGEIIDIVEH